MCDNRHLKFEPHQIRLVAGGEKLEYDGDTGTPTDSLIETNLLTNSVISEAKQGARVMSCNLKYIFLTTQMHKSEYIRIRYDIFRTTSGNYRT